MKGVTSYEPKGFEKKAFQKTDALARKIKADIKKFSKGRK